MENAAMGAFFDTEIESLCNIFTLEQPNFCDEFLGHSTPPFVDSEHFLPLTNQTHFSFHYDSISNTKFSDSTSYNNASQTTYDSYQNSHFSSPSGSDALFPIMDQKYHVLAPDFLATINVEDNASDNLGSPPQREVVLNRKHNNTLERDEREGEGEGEGEGSLKVFSPKKRARVSKDRNNNCIEADNYYEEYQIDGGEGENSDDGESKISQHPTQGDNCALKDTSISQAKKKRASRGAATDPQSLYARRRRERINERLRILQNLVPNGTKVDISTMLEEALHYVKFLQLQIRLLSSDELWMYAPIAYNGVDISLYKRISPFLLP